LTRARQYTKFPDPATPGFALERNTPYD
jgi:hypothetical protein